MVIRCGACQISKRRLHSSSGQFVLSSKTSGRPIRTGTGSGKSLCFFIPIIDAAICARAAREPARTPRYRDLSDESAGEQSDQLRPTFARYTGQESQEERERICDAKSVKRTSKLPQPGTACLMMRTRSVQGRSQAIQNGPYQPLAMPLNTLPAEGGSQLSDSNRRFSRAL
jgi:hypothetical protein